MTPSNASSAASQVARRYQICLQGELGPEWSCWFEGFTVRQENRGETLLTGMVEDQAALYGLLRKLRDVGLPLVSLQRLE